MGTRSKDQADQAVTRWMLGGEPPEPHLDKPAPEIEIAPRDLRNGDTHTGTDPLGRAIGPAEDHLKVKRVRNADGEIVTPKGANVSQAEGRARKIAEATGTKPEADDDPTPISPAEVAKLHAED